MRAIADWAWKPPLAVRAALRRGAARMRAYGDQGGSSGSHRAPDAEELALVRSYLQANPQRSKGRP